MGLHREGMKTICISHHDIILIGRIKSRDALESTPFVEHDWIVFEYRELWHFVTMYIKLQFLQTILPAKILWRC